MKLLHENYLNWVKHETRNTKQIIKLNLCERIMTAKTLAKIDLYYFFFEKSAKTYYCK